MFIKFRGVNCNLFGARDDIEKLWGAIDNLIELFKKGF